MNLEAFGRAVTEMMPAQKGGDAMEDRAKVVLRWVIIGALLSSFVIGALVLAGGSCSCADWIRPSQVISDQCKCEGDPDDLATVTEVDLDFTSKKKGEDAADRTCTVWVLMEHLNKTRVWMDSKVRCRR